MYTSNSGPYAVAPQMMRRVLLIAALAISLVSMFWLSSVGAPKAEANVIGQQNICYYKWLAPYGQQPADRCMSPIGGRLFRALVQSYEKSGCVSVYNGTGELVHSWVCSAGPNSQNDFYIPDDWTYRRGIIRNNTTGAWAHVSGWQWCYDCW